MALLAMTLAVVAAAEPAPLVVSFAPGVGGRYDSPNAFMDRASPFGRVEGEVRLLPNLELGGGLVLGALAMEPSRQDARRDAFGHLGVFVRGDVCASCIATPFALLGAGFGGVTLNPTPEVEERATPSFIRLNVGAGCDAKLTPSLRLRAQLSLYPSFEQVTSALGSRTSSWAVGSLGIAWTLPEDGIGLTLKHL